MTATERKRRQRERMTAAGIRTINITLSEYTSEIVRRYCEVSEVPEAIQLPIIASIGIEEWAKDVERRWPEIIERMAALKESKVEGG